MQFITTGNRIAVENFTLGDLYTITFTSGIYINSACIGIGENFVSFQRNAPELLFTLNMETAELVSSIDLYSGGTGTNNYNDLTNKPQINDVELIGNKSLSDLGIQETISDIDTIRSGAAAGATAVQPDALADYQPIISDLDTIRSGAAAGATAVQPDALADYQPKIDSSHKLDADLVDDTSSTNKFATQSQLDQIELNKNNILLLTANGGGKNKLKITATSSAEMTINDDKSVSITVNASTQKQYNLTGWIPNNYVGMKISGMTVNSNASTGYFISVQYSNNGSSWANETDIATIGSATILNYPYINVGIVVRGGNNLDGVLFKPMISDNGEPYQPYALSNAELTSENETNKNNILLKATRYILDEGNVNTNTKTFDVSNMPNGMYMITHTRFTGATTKIGVSVYMFYLLNGEIDNFTEIKAVTGATISSITATNNTATITYSENGYHEATALYLYKN